MVQSSNLKFPSRRFSLTPSGLCSAIRFEHRIHLFLDELAVALQELLIDDTGVIRSRVRSSILVRSEKLRSTHSVEKGAER